MPNYKTTTLKDFIEHCSFYKVALNDTVREVTIDSVVTQGEGVGRGRSEVSSSEAGGDGRAL